MGRLLNPGLGELADRFTILQLKVFHGDPRKTSHFHTEQAQILMTMERQYAGILDGSAVQAQINTLREANKLIWRLEDRMAEYAKKYTTGAEPVTEADVRACAAVAVDIWGANQDRNLRIDELNRLAGAFQGPEKL